MADDSKRRKTHKDVKSHRNLAKCGAMYKGIKLTDRWKYVTCKACLDMKGTIEID